MHKKKTMLQFCFMTGYRNAVSITGRETSKPSQLLQEALAPAPCPPTQGVEVPPHCVSHLLISDGHRSPCHHAHGMSPNQPPSPSGSMLLLVFVAVIKRHREDDQSPWDRGR